MKKSTFLGSASVRENIRITDSPSHPVFKGLYEKQKKAIWFPEELNLQQDILDYNELNVHEKNIFDSAVGYFISSELLVQNVIINGFFPYILDPYAKMSFTVQMFMESIHSDFFEFVLYTFNMDRKKIYNLTLDDDILRAKQEIVINEVDKITYGKIDPESLEGKKKILKAILLNNIIQEGIFFYSSFAHFFALKDLGKMLNVASGVELVLVDESLHLQNGLESILIILEETPEIIDDKIFVGEIKDIILKSVELELAYIKMKFSSLNIMGLTYRQLEEYIYYITDRRLVELGFEPHFKINENPLKFLQKEDFKKLTNFFEVTSTEYTNF
jgi:ribonucleoside-diphosphate reductase beta chain